MNLLWPGFLFLLILIPLLIGIYIWVMRRHRRFAVRFSSLSLVREAVSRQSWLRRHLPFILFLLALAGLSLAMSRPMATVMVPSNQATVILAIDVSRSMCSADIPPNRLEAAKKAALEFVQSQHKNRQIGIVAFSGFAELIQPPTGDVTLLQNAITGLVTARRTAIGSAILRSLDSIAEIDSNVEPSDLNDLGNPSSTARKEYIPHIIVLLTDGASNAGPDPLVAATQAVDRGVRVYTIGFGTMHNTSPMNCGDQFQQFGFYGSGGFGERFNGGGGGFGFRREIDEATLTQIATMTGGKYYLATSGSELENVLGNLPTYFIATRQSIEISAFFTAFAALMIIIAVVLSFLWHPLG
jgi:Ca-activated chloride channel family protein